MLRSLTFGKFAAVLMLLALPLTATGCRSTTGGGWGWAPPSLSSLNPWSSSTETPLAANHKPSNQVPTPPSTMLAGNGLARNGAPTSSSNNYGTNGRPTGTNSYQNNDYGTRQVSGTQSEGYRTGQYATGAGGTGASAAGNTQNGPYGSAGAPNYGGTATADRRSDPAYGSGNTNNWQGGSNNQPPQNAQPQTNPYTSPGAPSGQYPATPGGQNYQSNANPPGSGAASPYAGSVGLSSGPTRPSAPASSAGYGADAYRPGSTARANADVQRASFDNQNAPASGSSGNYPTTAAGDDSAYQ